VKVLTFWEFFNLRLAVSNSYQLSPAKTLLIKKHFRNIPTPQTQIYSQFNEPPSWPCCLPPLTICVRITCNLNLTPVLYNLSILSIYRPVTIKVITKLLDNSFLSKCFAFTALCTIGILSTFMIKLDMKLDLLLEQQADTLSLLRNLVASGSCADTVDDLFSKRLTNLDQLNEMERMLEAPDYRKKLAWLTFGISIVWWFNARIFIKNVRAWQYYVANLICFS